MRSSRAIWAWSTPWEEARPASVACLSPSSPSTLTYTRAWRRSGLVSTAVTVTNPMRGSFRPSAIRAESTSRTASLTRLMRSPATLVLPQYFFGRRHAPLDSGPIREPRQHIALELRGRLRQRARFSPDKCGRESSPLPQIVMRCLRHGRPEAPLELRLERAQLLALALEARVVGEVQLYLEQADKGH